LRLRGTTATGIMALAAAAALALLVPVAPAVARQGPVITAAPGEDISPLTVDDIVQMLLAKLPEEEILGMMKGWGALPLTIDEIARLKRAGASDRLIRGLTAKPQAPAVPATPEQEQAAVQSPAGTAEEEMAPGKLRLNKVLFWERSGMPLSEIASRVDDKGLKQQPDLELLLDLLEKKKSPDFVRLLAQGRSKPPDRLARIANETPAAPPQTAEAGMPVAESPAAATVKRKGTLRTEDVLTMLKEGQSAATVTGTVIARGMKEPITAADEKALRAAGADDQLIKVVHLTGGSVGQTAAGTQTQAAPALRLESLPPGELPSVRRDTILVTSVPSEMEVYIAPAGMPRGEMFAKHYYVGRTPVAMPVAPGRYNVIVRKQAGNFEQEMIPAWRTLHDGADDRLLLDNADLTFDPRACCLPGSLDDSVQVRQLETGAGVPLGDRFGGLPPYLFDGESLQILSIAEGAVQASSKLYPVEKGPQEAVVVVATFFQADANPLDTSLLGEEFSTAAFDGFLETPALSYLADPAQVTSLAGALRIAPQEAASAISMLRRTGKGIVPHDASPGRRMVVLSVDGPGQIRVQEATLRPEDPFAALMEASRPAKKKKKSRTPPPPEPPPLPELRRHVVPGLGQPRLIVNNTTRTDTALIFSDGQLYFVPANTEREFVLDPGTYVVRLAAPGAEGPEPQGQLHFSYQARYTMTL